MQVATVDELLSDLHNNGVWYRITTTAGDITVFLAKDDFFETFDFKDNTVLEALAQAILKTNILKK